MSEYEDKSGAPNALELGQVAYKEGCIFYKSEELNDAKRSFETSLEYCPDDSQAWFALGNCYDALKSSSRAEVCFRKSLQHSVPEARSQVYFNLGNSLFDQGKLTEAITCYSKVVDESIAYQSAQKNMALAQNSLASRS